MTDIKMLVEELVAYALDRKLIEAPDAVYSRNLLLDLLQLEEPAEGIVQGQPPVEAFENMRAKCSGLTPQPILDKILDYATGKGLQIDFPQFMNLVLWTTAKPAKYICIEPWIGMCTCSTDDDVFEHRANVQYCEPGEEKEYVVNVTIL